jgi:hypothetical protein
MAGKMTTARLMGLRASLLDQELLGFSSSFPANCELCSSATKNRVKKLASRRVSTAIIQQRKDGFSGTSLVLEPLNDLNDRLSGVLLDRQVISRVRFQKQAIETLIADDNRCGGNSKDFSRSPF